MISPVALNLLLQLSMFAPGNHAYSTAFEKTAQTGTPLVVLVGAEWCPGCREMKYSVMPQLEKMGTLDKVAFAYVNTDQQRQLAGKLMRGGSIPQLIMYRKTATGWSRQQLTGAQSTGDIENFLSRGDAPKESQATSSQ